jgi:hypothetical protein
VSAAAPPACQLLDAFSLTVPANARRSPTMLTACGSNLARFDLDELKERFRQD